MPSQVSRSHIWSIVHDLLVSSIKKPAEDSIMRP